MNYRIKDIPCSERPRERLLSVGCEGVSNKELLSIILKTGIKNRSVDELALDILNRYSLDELRDVSVEELMNINGIGEVKAIEVVACIELGRRIFLNKETSLERLDNPKDIWASTRYLISGKKQEYFIAYYFNNKQELIERKIIFMGTINSSVTHTREIFKEAYRISASGIVCVHNHPSGDVTPSRADINFTKTLMKTGQIQGIPVIDHIIVSDGAYYSFYEHLNILN